MNKESENIKTKKNPFKSLSEDTKGIIYFVVILLVSHFFWKFLVIGDESNEIVKFLGMNITYPFAVMSEHIAELTHKVLNFIGYDTSLLAGNVVCHNDTRHAIAVIWACSGIKQAYIFFCIIAFYKGPWKHKLWYIPLGLLVVYLFNNFRIIFITAIYNKHPEQFDLWHEHIMKYAFYAVIFLMWVIWNEKFARKRNTLANSVTWQEESM